MQFYESFFFALHFAFVVYVRTTSLNEVLFQPIIIQNGKTVARSIFSFLPFVSSFLAFFHSHSRK